MPEVRPRFDMSGLDVVTLETFVRILARRIGATLGFDVDRIIEDWRRVE